MTCAGRRIGTGAIFTAVWLVTAGFVNQASAADQTGIELVGRSPDEPVLARWTVHDVKSKKQVAKVERRWGFASLPAGQYQVNLLPDDYQAVEIPWATVDVAEGKTTTVTVNSGIDLTGRAPDEQRLEWWNIIDVKTKKRVAKVYRRWGFTPLPAGQYRITVQPDGYQALEIPWATIEVAEGKIATVKVNSGIDLTGRGENEPALSWWYAVDANTKKQVAKVYQRWGFTPLPAGQYQVSLLPDGYQALEVPWTTVEVAEAKIAPVEVNSGIDVVGRGDDDPPLYWWKVFDANTKKQVAKAYQHWGFTPLPTGKYNVTVVPEGYQALEIPWTTVDLPSGKTATVEVKSGVELVDPKGESPPDWWYVQDAGKKSAVAKTYQRWGFTPLPPGKYDVTKPPLRWTAVEVAAGKVVQLKEIDLATRLANVTGAGQKMERERDPEGYKKLQEDVERAIRRGASWLKKHRLIANVPSDLRDDYATIGVLALVHSGEFERDPELQQRCLDYLLRRPLNTGTGTYANSLTAVALRDLNRYRYRQRVFECAQWLVENQGWTESDNSWGYGDNVPGIGDEKPAEKPTTKNRTLARYRPGESLEVVRSDLVPDPRGSFDNSNTQFAVLGLHSSALADIRIPRASWERIEKHFRTSQNTDGGWGYHGGGSYGSMTCAGTASLVVARHHLGAEQPTLDPAVVSGLEWLAWTFNVEENPNENSNQYYYLYGLERVGVLADSEFFGEQEWYPVGARYLVGQQKADGSWISKNSPPTGSYRDYLDTCYAILFLRRATLSLEPPEPSLLSVAYEKDRVPLNLMPAVELILDSSGSMKELVENRPKIEIARAVTKEVLEGLPEEIQVGLRLYGHWGIWLPRRDNPRAAAMSPQDPRMNTDSELVAPIGPLGDDQRAKMQKWINWAQPRGKTPLVYSLLQAKNDFPSGRQAPKTVVLVSDGEETCGGKLEDVAAAYRDSDIGVVIHVVGFDIAGTVAQQELEQIAKLGGGRYYSARSARELAAALRSAIESTGFEVSDESGKLVAQGAINGDPVELDPGNYRVAISGSQVEPLAISITSGQEFSVILDETGKLKVVRP